MRRNRAFDADHGWSLAVAAIVHALLAALWWMAPDRREDAPPADALQVTWIERPVPRSPPPPVQPEREAAVAPAPRTVRAAPVPVPRTRDDRRVSVPASAPATGETSRPLSAVFLEQGSALARNEASHDFRRNPLLDPRPAIAAPPPERIGMKTPLTPARVVAGIGQLFGGPGYTTDPCPRIRRNIGNLRTAGAQDAALQEELRRHRQFCQ